MVAVVVVVIVVVDLWPCCTVLAAVKRGAGVKCVVFPALYTIACVLGGNT